MILSDLIGCDVTDAQGRFVGRVSDVRFRQDGPSLPAEMVLHGLIISPHTATSFMGYDRQRVDSPWLIARFLSWRQRGSFLVLWRDVQRLDLRAEKEGTLRLRSGYTPYSPLLQTVKGQY